jgi:hypothetical protein
MTKGKAALPLSVVAEQSLFFMTFGGPKAHNFSCRDDKGEAALPLSVVAETEPIFHHLGWAEGP